MLAILGALGAAVAWATGIACSARATRALGPPWTLGWAMLIGLLVLVPALAVAPVPHLHTRASLWLALSGVGNVVGLLMSYRALRRGALGVVAPILAAEGGVTSAIAIAAGQSLAADRGLALLAVLVGVVLTAAGGAPGKERLSDWHGPPALWAAAAALSFGAGLYGTGRAGTQVPLAWAVLPPRLLGVLVVTAPLALRSRLGGPWRPWRLAAAAGCCEVAGFFAYAFGARHDLVTTAVLASLSGAVAAGLGRALFGERLRSRQVAGVAVVAAGVATLSALTA